MSGSGRGAQDAVGIVGAGAAGSALAARLCARGVPIFVHSRSAARASALTASLGSGASQALELAQLAGVRTLWITVSDRAIESVASALAEALPAQGPGGGSAVALHASGYHDEAPLAALARAGWATGGAHPLVSLAGGPRDAEQLGGAWFALCGAGVARERARELVAILGGHELSLGAGPDVKRRYHASAALLAGGLAALFDTTEAGVEGAQGRAALAHLARSVLDNLARDGAAVALTGPIARGDVEVMRGHLAVLNPEARALYAAFLPALVRLAREQGTLDAAGARAIAELL